MNESPWETLWARIEINILKTNNILRHLSFPPRNRRETELFWVQELKMGPIGCPETSVRKCLYSLCNNPEERGSFLE